MFLYVIVYGCECFIFVSYFMDVSALFLHMDIQLSKDRFLEIILFSLNVLGMLVKDQLMVTVSVCSSVLKLCPIDLSLYVTLFYTL